VHWLIRFELKSSLASTCLDRRAKPNNRTNAIIQVIVICEVIILALCQLLRRWKVILRLLKAQNIMQLLLGLRRHYYRSMH